MLDVPQASSWKDQLSAAFTATEEARAKRMGTPQEPVATATAEPPESEAVEASPSVTTETQPEQVAPAQVVEQGEEDFLSDQEGDAPEIQKLKANLRSGWQKKMTDLDKRLKELDQKAGTLTDAQKKAQVLDALLASEDPAKAIQAAREGLGIAPAAAESQRVFQPRVLGERFKEIGLHPDVIDPIEDAIDAALEAKLLPILMPYAAYIQQQITRGATSEWDTLVAKYGDEANQYKAKAYELAGLAKTDLETGLIAASKAGIVKRVAAPAKKEPTQAPPQLARQNGLPPDNRGASTYAEERNRLRDLLLAKSGPSRIGGFSAPHRK